MAYLCLKCYKVIEDRVIQKARIMHYTDKMGCYYVCPYTKCQGEAVWIDELMLPIITTLNKKGYKTEYSCSGHSYQENPNCYIMFKTKPPTIPQGFTYEGKLIRKMFREHGTSLFKTINQTAVELLEWANELPKEDNTDGKVETDNRLSR